jgi:hypothetical protein
MHSQSGPPGVATQSHVVMLQPDPYEHDMPTSPLQVPLGGLCGQTGGGHGGSMHVHAWLSHVHSGPHPGPKLHCCPSDWQNVLGGGGDAGHITGHPHSVHDHEPWRHVHWLHPSPAGQLDVDVQPGSGVHVPPSPPLPPSSPLPPSPVLPPSPLSSTNALPPHAATSSAIDATTIAWPSFFMIRS